MGINNKVRQLSFGYKMVTNNFRQVVNDYDYIDNGFRTPIGPPLFAAVKGIAQTYSGLYNGVPLKVRITREEFGLNFSQGNDGISNTNNYLKVITYKFHQAWVAYVNSLSQANPPGELPPSPPKHKWQCEYNSCKL